MSLLDKLAKLEERARAKVGAATPELRLRAIYRKHGPALVEVAEGDDCVKPDVHDNECRVWAAAQGPQAMCRRCRALTAMEHDVDKALEEAGP